MVDSWGKVTLNSIEQMFKGRAVLLIKEVEVSVAGTKIS